MKIFNLPDLGEGLPDAEVVTWHVKEGDTVKVDDLLVSMETAKALVDVPSPYAGKITKLHGKTGDIILTDHPLVSFESEDGQPAAPDEQGATVAGKIEVGSKVLQENAMGITPHTTHSETIKALPAVRAMAKLLGIDLKQITGTGQQGEVTLNDIQRVMPNQTTRPTPRVEIDDPEKVIEPLRGARRSMAEAMTATQDVAHVSAFDEADINAWAQGTDITYRLLRALITACQAEPALNAHFYKEANERILWKQVNIGIAMDSPHGLFAPVVKKANELSQEAIRAKINEFKKTVQDRSIAASDLQGSTIQLSNFGVFAGHYATSLIVPPNVAILGMGRIYKRAVEENEHIVMHRFMPLCVTVDHRAVTGGEATRFLKAMIEDLQKSQ